jgi:hypothetical protein
MQRINATLAKRDTGQRLHRCRKTDKLFETCGTYWLRDNQNGAVAKDHVDLEKLGLELGCIAEWETVS